MLSLPDVLVLGGGGVLGEAWLSGVLAGIEDGGGLELRRCEYFVGTSAGSIVAATLAAGVALERPDGGGGERSDAGADAAPAPAPASFVTALAGRAGRAALTVTAPAVPIVLALGAPFGALARAAVLRATPRAAGSLADLVRRVEATGVEFDGRLRVVAVVRGSGRRVVFGQPGAPAASVAEAVEASCTIPWMFAPVRLGGVEYVDGGFWSPTNLDAAPAGRGTHVLCLNPTAGLAGRGRGVAVVRNLSGTATAVEAGALRGRGAIVQTVAPDDTCAAAMGTNLMDHGPRAAVLAAAYGQGLALGRLAPRER